MSDNLFPRSWKVQVDTLDVSSLDIDFRILATLKPEPNKCSLTVWNLNPDHRGQLLKRSRPNPDTKKLVGVPVQVEAGYNTNTSVLFSGDLREVSSAIDNNDWKTTLTGDDGGRAYREARFDNGGICFTKGQGIGAILSQCADAMGVGLGNAANFEATASIVGIGSTLTHTIVLEGNVAKALTSLLHSIGLTWSIQRGALQLLQKGEPLDQSAILISPSSGLLGSPESTIDASVSLGNPQAAAVGSAPKAKKSKDPSVLKLKTMLIPGMVPGRKISLQSQAFNGGYMLTECLYVGQSWAPQNWHIECVARAY